MRKKTASLHKKRTKNEQTRGKIELLNAHKKINVHDWTEIVQKRNKSHKNELKNEATTNEN
jgi:hypothetical protein